MSDPVKKIIAETNDRTVFKALGMIVETVDANETIVRLDIDDRHRQHMGLVHGGVYVLLAESAASIAAACTLTSSDTSVVALEINANHLRSSVSGSLSAHSHCLHRGKRTLVYEVKVVDQDKNLVSIARCTLMVTKRS